MRNKSIKENYDETERIQSSVGQGYHSFTANIFFDSPKNVRIALNSPRDIIYDLRLYHLNFYGLTFII